MDGAQIQAISSPTVNPAESWVARAVIRATANLLAASGDEWARTPRDCRIGRGGDVSLVQWL